MRSVLAFVLFLQLAGCVGEKTSPSSQTQNSQTSFGFEESNTFTPEVTASSTAPSETLIPVDLKLDPKLLQDIDSCEIYKKKYVPGTYVCAHYSRDLATCLADKGYSVNQLAYKCPSAKDGHAIIAIRRKNPQTGTEEMCAYEPQSSENCLKKEENGVFLKEAPGGQFLFCLPYKDDKTFNEQSRILFIEHYCKNDSIMSTVANMKCFTDPFNPNVFVNDAFGIIEYLNNLSKGHYPQEGLADPKDSQFCKNHTPEACATGEIPCGVCCNSRVESITELFKTLPASSYTNQERDKIINDWNNTCRKGCSEKVNNLLDSYKHI